MKCRFTWILGAFFCVSLDAHTDTCSDIGTLVSHAKSKFSSIKGQHDPVIGVFDSVYKLPGAKRCNIIVDSEFNEAEYTCVWEASSRNEAESSYQGMLADIEKCTHSTGRSRGARSSTYGNTYSSHTFEINENDTQKLKIRTHFGESKRRPGQVKMYFSLEYEGAE